MSSHRALVLPVLLLAVATPASGGQSAIPAAFADLGLGARVMGMGGAAAAGTGRAIDLFWNPAGLADLGHPELVAMQTEQFDLVPAYLLAGARSWGAGHGAALGVLSSGDALLRENTLLAAWGQTLPGARRVQIGAALKLRYASFGSGGTFDGVTGHAWGTALDLGVRGRAGRLQLGLFLEEALGSLHWTSSVAGTYWESVPPTLTGGLALPAGDLLLAVDLETGLDDERPARLAVGLEWTPHAVLALRGGLRQRLDEDASRFLSLGAGLGKDLDQGGRMQLDTAYLFHDLGGSLRIALCYCW
ncbi:MAG: hypothetical protein JW819_09350 [Candidatus Krumholzibacteriota bacterium]|nr:hypothetical protein [Candidatus Krumholzibacteriota bacterium]